MPPPPEDEAPARPGPTLRVADWLAAEAGQGRGLARAAAAFARLDERVRQAGPGALRRLALAEAAAISWQAGDRVAAERLALYDLDRADMGRDDAGALGAAHWALRRLAMHPGGGPGPEHGLDAFLARDGVAADPAVPGWEDGLAALGAALPLVRAAWGFAAWRAAGLSAGVLEPAVIAARLGGAEGRGLGFLPLAQVAAPYFAGGDAAARLAAWARAAEAGALRALMTPRCAGGVAGAGDGGDGAADRADAAAADRGAGWRRRRSQRGWRRGPPAPRPPGRGATSGGSRRRGWCARSPARAGSASGRRRSDRRGTTVPVLVAGCGADASPGGRRRAAAAAGGPG